MRESSTLTGVPLAIELVNTVDNMNDPPDFLIGLDRLKRFFRHVGAQAAADAARERDLPAVRELRERITEAMDSRDEAIAGALLARIAADLDVRPRLAASQSGRWEIRHGPHPARGPEFIGPSVVYGLMEFLAAGNWDRLGRCAGAPCCCVFVDRTRNRSRRYCCGLCADRINQARARSRRKTGDG